MDLQGFYMRDTMKGHIDNGTAIVGKYSYGIVSFIGNISKFYIGKYCSVANGCTVFLGHNHRSDWVSTYPFSAIPDFFAHGANRIQGHPATNGDVKIGNDVWIGTSVTILSGVTIGDGAVIGANALVTKDVPPYAIYGGNPASLIRFRFDEEIRQRLLCIKWWDWDDEKVAQAIPYLLNPDIISFINRYS